MALGDSRSPGGRDVQIDWLRGLAMACVIVNHSKLSSLLSWFSYERMCVVTAAEVFVVLSGTVLGIVYGRRLDRHGWGAVARGLGRRAVLLYAAFVGVTVSVLALAAVGVDVRALAPSSGAATWFVVPRMMDASAWRDVLLMRAGPWAFEIIGLYVWLVAAAAPCLLIMQWAGWRLLIAVSWAVYLWYRLDPHTVTGAGFESAFPLLAWQLLFVHGIAIGYHRDHIRNFMDRAAPKWLPSAAVLATAAFMAFAFCNPWTPGPSWLRLTVLGPDQFTQLYGSFFSLKELGAGRLLNLAVGLPVAYAALTRYWSLVRPLHSVFITLGQHSLGAFVLHVYAVLFLAYLPLAGDPLIDTLVQVAIIIGIVGVLRSLRRFRAPQPVAAPLAQKPLAA
jgi:hypothetical protein